MTTGPLCSSVRCPRPDIYITMNDTAFDAFRVVKDRAAGRFVPAG
jgi:hypothetical protein